MRASEVMRCRPIAETGTIKPQKPVNADQPPKLSERQARVQQQVRDEDVPHAAMKGDRVRRFGHLAGGEVIGTDAACTVALAPRLSYRASNVEHSERDDALHPRHVRGGITACICLGAHPHLYKLRI